MSLIDFTHNTCKTKDILNKQILDNFEKHFAMYSFTTIKNMPNIEVLKNNEAYIIRGTSEECKEIIKALSSFKCSHFNDTLVPVFTMVEEGLKVEFEIDGV